MSNMPRALLPPEVNLCLGTVGVKDYPWLTRGSKIIHVGPAARSGPATLQQPPM